MHRRDLVPLGNEVFTSANQNDIKVKGQGHLKICILMSFHIVYNGIEKNLLKIITVQPLPCNSDRVIAIIDQNDCFLYTS